MKAVVKADSVRVMGDHPFNAADMNTEEYPGFPTDMQAQFMVLACLANGQSIIKEMIFDLVVHAWDLGTAIGYPEPVPAHLAEAIYPEVQKFGDLSSSGMFDAPVDMPDDASTLDGGNEDDN